MKKSAEATFINSAFLITAVTVLLSSAAAHAKNSGGQCPVSQNDLGRSVANLRATVLGCPENVSSDAIDTRERLIAEGFYCGGDKDMARSGTNGFRCRGHVNGYGQPVNVYIPAGFQRDRALTLTYHFVGFTDRNSQSPFAGANGNYGKFLTDSKKNALLIVPESIGKDASYAHDLGTASKLNHFFSTMNQKLQSAGLSATEETPVVLTGHSGAAIQLARMGRWAAAGEVPQLQHVRGIGLFDSVYTQHNAGLVDLGKIVKRNGSENFYSIYNPHGGNAKTNRALQSTLQSSGEGGRFHTDGSIEHMAFMHKYMTGFLESAIEN